MKIVLDTNVLLQIVSARSAHHWLWLELIAGNITLCLTTDILDEYIEKLDWFYTDAIFAENTAAKRKATTLPTLVRTATDIKERI